jgi:hypothetical protein
MNEDSHDEIEMRDRGLDEVDHHQMMIMIGVRRGESVEAVVTCGLDGTALSMLCT